MSGVLMMECNISCNVECNVNKLGKVENMDYKNFFFFFKYLHVVFLIYI